METIFSDLYLSEVFLFLETVLQKIDMAIKISKKTILECPVPKNICRVPICYLEQLCLQASGISPGSRTW